jgi:prenyltransferase beta subunit
MSVRLEMLQVARLAPKVLGESAALVHPFFLRQQNADGGFKDRSGRSDLYYTVFGLEGLLALQAPPPLKTTAAFLDSFGAGEGLDFVHLCSLARCRAALVLNKTADEPPADWSRKLSARIERFRSADGGYHVVPGSPHGTAYGCFLAVAAYQDLKLALPAPLDIARCLKFLETGDGAWANERKAKCGATNSTAAAVTLLRQLSVPIASAVGDWLLARCHHAGGFSATPDAPIPDLLSTATALHALAGLERDFGPLKERCLDFIDTLWSNEGGFHGHWGDDTLDCEYTYYGLLALGHLSL